MCKLKDKRSAVAFELYKIYVAIQFCAFLIAVCEMHATLSAFAGTHQQLFPSNTSIIEHNTSDEDINKNKLP